MRTDTKKFTDDSITQTGFDFHKRRAAPAINGIVVAQENEEVVMEVGAAMPGSQTLADASSLRLIGSLNTRRWKKPTKRSKMNVSRDGRSSSQGSPFDNA